MFLLLLLSCLHLVCCDVKWTSPTPRAASTQITGNLSKPCGITQEQQPPLPKVECVVGRIYNLTYTLNNMPAAGTVHNISFNFIKFNQVGNVLTLTQYNMNESPVSGVGFILFTVPEEAACDFNAGQRCAIQVWERRPTISYVSCSDVVVVSELHNASISWSFRPPAGAVVISSSVFLSRFFDKFGTAGTVVAAGFTAANTMLVESSYARGSDGVYTVTLLVRDNLVVSNNVFQDFLTAAEMAYILQANSTTAERSAIAPENVGLQYSLLDGTTPATPPTPAAPTAAPPISEKALDISLILVAVILWGALLYFLYTKFVVGQPIVPVASSSET
eukprot:g48762.t1